MVKMAEQTPGECQACKGLGVIYPPKTRSIPIQVKQADGSIRAVFSNGWANQLLPLACALCDAGALELQAREAVERMRGPATLAAEIEFNAFRKAKG